MSIKDVVKLVLSWRLATLIISISAIFIISPHTRFTNLTSKPSANNIVAAWTNFDGLHYLDIAKYGYGYQHKTDMDYAFFPFYPLVVRYLNFFGSYVASGLIWSHVFFIFAIYFLYKIILLDYKKHIARSAILLLIFFPASFFFGSVYTESLFLLLIILSFYFARKGNFLLAGVVAAMASATRITGIFIWPGLVWEYWLQNQKSLKKAICPKILYLLLPPLGILWFIYFQSVKTGDPLFFVNIQSNFAGRGTDKLILLYQVFYRYAKMVIFIDHTSPLFYTVLLELLSSILVLVTLILSFKKIRFSYWIFVLLSYFLPTFTGTFMSMPRFTIVLFPVFIYLAIFFERSHPFFKICYYLLSIIFGILGIILFTNGYFVA